MFSLHRRPDAAGPAPFDRRRLLGGAAALLLAAAGGFGLARWTLPAAGAPPAESEASADPHADEGEALHVPLSAEEAERLGIVIDSPTRAAGELATLPGRVILSPGAEAAVDAPVAGVVVAVRVGPGDRVARGAELATIRSAEGAASRSEVDAAEAGAIAARAAERRDRALFADGWIAASRLEVTVAEARRAEAELRAARARAQTYGAPDSDGLLQIRTPIAGVVTAVSVAPGQVLHEEALQVASVSDARQVELAFQAPPQYAHRIGVGDRLSATAPGGRTLSAVVTAVAPADSAGVALIRARSDEGLPPVGAVMSARLTSGTGGVLSVPQDALQTLDGAPSVFVFDGDGFSARPVTPGARSGGRVEIVSGLRGHERIAARNAFLLKAQLGRGDVEHAH